MGDQSTTFNDQPGCTLPSVFQKIKKGDPMTSVHRIKNVPSTIVLCAIIIGGIVFVGVIQKTPDARAAADRQLQKEIVQERLTCEKWGTRASTENHTACIADLNETRVKYDKRRINDVGSGGNGLTILW
jgi:hypothetical protein